ncbi:MAG: secondary thiamine-phosphate synthase enzyme YjbQ [Candidatus Woesearchaeota archaeon]
MIETKRLKIQTTRPTEVTDITTQVQESVQNAGLQNGQVLIYTMHTTTGIGINESETRLMEDMTNAIETLASREKKYLHDDIHLRDCPKDEPKNGHAHIKALHLNRSEIIPVVSGKLTLGRWQAILHYEMDGTRERTILIQMTGEQK